MAAIKSLEEARAEIEEIARRKGTFSASFKQEAEQEAKKGRRGMLQAIEGGEEIREDLEKALQIISSDLYTNRARFLMEVIQNADDNNYTSGQTPTVSINIRPGNVTIECNEDGFSKENIQALCRTGRSSKKPGQGYTGEKGIGFKSVFKIADRAHIRSTPYFFQLDQTRDLGMITPQWDKAFFDRFEGAYQTTIVLESVSNPATNFSTVLEGDVKAIDPTLILFLRRIRRLHLTVFDSNQMNNSVISKRFRQVGQTIAPGIIELIDEDTNSKLSLFKYSGTTIFNGTEPRRPNVNRTDIVLAFPVDQEKPLTYTPLIREQNLVFAYLPLGNFGFKFVIQADFLTTSNRQSVDEDSSWNQHIAKLIPYAFANAVSCFNADGSNVPLVHEELRKMWPLYLSTDTVGLNTYWTGIKRDIIRHLGGTNVIKTQSGSLGMPKDLMFLDWAHDRHGQPILGDSSDYVSVDYPSSVRQALLSLGVNAPNSLWLGLKLSGLQNDGLLRGKMQNMNWCSDLADVILKASGWIDEGNLRRILGHIPLIPLEDGTWSGAPSEDSPIYFPASLGMTVPPGLSLSLVNEEACFCPYRKALFRKLGVKDCDTANVVERILDYHAKTTSAIIDHIIAQVKYLYKAQEYLRSHNTIGLWFSCPNSKYLRRGSATYVDVTVGGDLKQLFSGYSEASFLDSSYYSGLDPIERTRFALWLGEKAQVALVPRFISSHPHGLHADFIWLLNHKSDQVLNIMYKNRVLYMRQSTDAVKEELSGYKFLCKSGVQAALRTTYIPLPILEEKIQTFGEANNFNFLTLPSGDPEEWEFMSSFGVGVKEGLDFYIWVLRQWTLDMSKDVNKSKNLYLAIQARTIWLAEIEMVRKVFSGEVWINLTKLKDCVWHGPRNSSKKSALYPIYGQELDQLFRRILNVPNITANEAEEHIKELRNRTSTTIEDVIEIYVLIQKHCAHIFSAGDTTAYIAIPSTSGAELEWKSPSQCVWGDDEFSQNELTLESKIAIRHIVKQHAPTAVPFFTEVLKLPNAGIAELIADLRLMQREKRDEPKRVHLLYERISNSRRGCKGMIKGAFEESPLVFLRGINKQDGKWLLLEDCIWTRSVLRSKHALMPSLNQYRDLFRDTLEVPNATMEMLVTDLLDETSSMSFPINTEDGYQYVKELIHEIARLYRDDAQLRRLEGKKCWPCRWPTGSRTLCSIGNFYVNDRQDLFDIFSEKFTFLDFDFDASRQVKGLLRNRGCNSFLSEEVIIETDSRDPLGPDLDFRQDLRSRTNALMKYFEFVGCKSPYEVRSLLDNIEVWISEDIKTSYKLNIIKKTKCEGGSSVEVRIDQNEPDRLEIHLSANRHTRDCALLTDFPGQLVEALKLEPSDLPDLPVLLQVPRASLNALLIKKGIIGKVSDIFEEDLVESSINGVSDDSVDQLSIAISNAVPSAVVDSIAVETTCASARSEAANTTPLPLVVVQPVARSYISSPTAREPLLQGNMDVPADGSPRNRPVTPRPTGTGLYSVENRNRNVEQLQRFSRNGDQGSEVSGDVFDMSTWREALNALEPGPSSTHVQVEPLTQGQEGLISNRNGEEMARDFEVGFLGEQFIYNLLHDGLKIPNFTGEENWTSSLRSRAGFSSFGREISDFTYKDTQGALTHYFLRTEHPYTTPEWLSTVYSNDNSPLYRLEVKSTTNQDPKTPFYMSQNQYELAKALRVTSATPSEVYVILRVSGLDALEDGARHRPQVRVYLDPYTCSENGILNFTTPTFTVTASR